MQNLHMNLDNFRRQIPNFKWSDQSDMAAFASQYSTRCSTDLKSATDRIPRDLFNKYIRTIISKYGPDVYLSRYYHILLKGYPTLQKKFEDQKAGIFVGFTDSELKILDLYRSQTKSRFKELGYQITDIIDYISSQKFYNKELKGIVSYSVGQPMGMLGSFPILDISNYLMASHSSDNDEDFTIVGDDIVFISSSTMEKYMEVCSALGIELSLDKTYKNGFAQAVGREISDN